jgi:hypothetical protein
MSNYNVKIVPTGSTRALVTYRNVTATRARSLFLSYVKQGLTLGRSVYVCKGNALVVGYGSN